MSSGLVPAERSASEVPLRELLVSLHGCLGDVLEDFLGGEVDNLNSLLGSNNEPVEFLREENAVNGGFAVDLSEELSLDEIPNHNLTVTGSGSQESGVVYHVERVDLSLVSDESVHQVHVQVVPHLDGLIPGGGDADSGLLCVIESNTGNGIGVLVLVDSVLAFGTSVPDLDSGVESTGDNLTIIMGNGDGENILGVANKLADSSSLSNVPEADSAVPG